MFSNSATSSASNINANINSIPMLNGTNFKTWHENLQIVLGVMDLDLALRVSSPVPLTVESSYDEKRDIERWEKSNHMCLMIIKKCDAPKPGCPLTTRQPAENLYVSYRETHT